jgi:DNA-binding transcriptional regulator/RsmH inhibitor MraZ
MAAAVFELLRQAETERSVLQGECRILQDQVQRLSCALSTTHDSLTCKQKELVSIRSQLERLSSENNQLRKVSQIILCSLMP